VGKFGDIKFGDFGKNAVFFFILVSFKFGDSVP